MCTARRYNSGHSGQNTALAAYFKIHDESIALSGVLDDEPDICITGSLLTLARMAGSGDVGAIRDGSLELIGDAETAQAFQELLSTAKPDFEESLSAVVGDATAHSLGMASNSVRSWASDVRSTMGANIREYLQEESRDLPSRYEFERFDSAVGKLRDDVGRLAARIDRLRERAD